jgi:hypothetical protein
MDSLGLISTCFSVLITVAILHHILIGNWKYSVFAFVYVEAKPHRIYIPISLCVALFQIDILLYIQTKILPETTIHGCPLR